MSKKWTGNQRENHINKTDLSPFIHRSGVNLQATVNSIQSILKEYWGYDSFRPMQEDIIHSILGVADAVKASTGTPGNCSLRFFMRR